MDRSWMNASRMSPTYEEGVEQFLEFASERSRPDEDGKYFLSLYKLFEREITTTRRHMGTSNV
ncbi:hypothetical protein HKD37_12G035025 [Glycine soja]